MIRLFADNLLPVFLAAGSGWLLAARLGVDPRPLARAAFFVFAPCLIFELIQRNSLPAGDLLRMVAFAVVSLASLAGLAGLAARALGGNRTMVAATVLVVLLPNAGNFGLAANRFAFGDDGLTHASVFFVASAVLTFTVGVLVASLGRAPLGRALSSLVRVPALWAVPMALITSYTAFDLPFPIQRTVGLLAEASIPAFLVVLGMQFHGRGIAGPLPAVWLAAAFRLLGGCAIGLILTPLFGLDGVARQAASLQSAMPSAVICIVIATEYDAEPAFVTSVVLLTTLTSPLTLTPLLAFLTS